MPKRSKRSKPAQPDQPDQPDQLTKRVAVDSPIARRRPRRAHLARAPRVASIAGIASIALSACADPAGDPLDECPSVDSPLADDSPLEDHDPLEPRPDLSPESPPDSPPAAMAPEDGLLVDVDHTVHFEPAPGCTSRAYLANLHWRAGLDGVPGRLELTRCDGERAGVSLYLDGHLFVAVSTADGPRPAQLSERTPSLTASRPGHARGNVHAWIAPTGVDAFNQTSTDSALPAYLDLRDRLADMPSACPDCASSLRDLGWTMAAALELACHERLGWGPDHAETCVLRMHPDRQ